jgi:hypothetical protein
VKVVEEEMAVEYGGHALGEEEPDNTNDFSAYLPYLVEKANEQGIEDQILIMLKGMGEEASQEPPSRKPPSYAATLMSDGLFEEEASRATVAVRVVS